MPEGKKFISRRDLATRWSKHITTIRRIEKKGVLTPHILPETRDVVYSLEEVERHENQSKITS